MLVARLRYFARQGVLVILLLIVSLMTAGCPSDVQKFAEGLGLELTIDGQLFMVICSESGGLKDAYGYIDERRFSVSHKVGEPPSTRVRLDASSANYQVDQPIDVEADVRLHIASTRAIKGFPGATQKWFDLRELRPGYVLGSAGDLVEPQSWVNENAECE